VLAVAYCACSVHFLDPSGVHDTETTQHTENANASKLITWSVLPLEIVDVHHVNLAQIAEIMTAKKKLCTFTHRVNVQGSLREEVSVRAVAGVEPSRKRFWHVTPSEYSNILGQPAVNDDGVINFFRW
jgi:hypothetical protein